MIEVWKPVPEYEKEYEVSNHGNIRSVFKIIKTINGKQFKRQGRILKQSLRGKYLAVMLSKDNKKLRVSVHRVVAKTFIGNSALTVNHIDGNRINNKVSNLEWVTRSDNTKMSFKTGQQNKFIESVRKRRKLQYVDFLLLIELKKQGLNYSRLSKIFKMERHTLHNVLEKQHYKDYWQKLENGF